MSEGGTNLVLETSGNETDLSPEDTGTIEEIREAENAVLLHQTSVNLVPAIGQRFVSQDAAYEFYCSFAKQCGFSIRRHRTRGKDGVGRGITRRDFTCYRGGYPQLKPSEDGKLQRNRKSSRCGCTAYLRIVRRADFDVPEWRITGFSNTHNHELLKSNEVRLLPAYCTLSADDKSRICMFAKAGMSVRQMLRLMELEKGVKLGNLLIDVRNLLQSFRNVDRDNDAIDLLSMCKNIKDDDPNFKYDFKIGTNNRLECIAWSYSSSLRQYEDFRDVVVFDTTHRLEAYDMLLGIWIGVDNHGMNSFFGCVLLRDENMQSFSWALKTFLGFVKGVTPQTILTDQNIGLKDAISIEMPSTKHAFCIWHIIAKFSDWFSPLLGSAYDAWRAEFHQLYKSDTVDDFEVGWTEMTNRYGLHGNKHIASLHALRMYWALPFLRSYFFAGMTSTFQPEKINTFIQRLLGAQSELDHFVEQVSVIANFRDQVGAKIKMQGKLNKVSLKTGSPIESHAATVFTHYAFCKLQEELVSAPQYASFQLEHDCFHVRHHTQADGGRKVICVPSKELISCSCHQFEFSGILCRHILRILSTNNCFHIPDQYLPNRWRRTNSFCRKSPCTTATTVENGKRFQELQSMVSSLMAEAVETEDCLEFAYDEISMVLSRIKGIPNLSHHETDVTYDSPSDSQILPEVEDDDDGIIQGFTSVSAHENFGKANDKRIKDGFEFPKKRRRCTLPWCGQFGHDAVDCPMVEGNGLNGDELGFL